MIVYNVRRRWFTLKDSAEAYRRLSGLKPAATRTVRIDDRDGLAGLLNVLCAPDDVPDLVAATPVEILDETLVANSADLDAIIPKFLRDEDERRRTGKYGSSLLP